MTNEQHSGRSRSLGTRFRGELASAYGHRGKSLNTLWYVYSPRTDSDWVLKSDLEWDHYVFVEADPSVISVDYSPEPRNIQIDDENVIELQIDAIITFRDGTVEWREIRPEGKASEVEQFRNSRRIEAVRGVAEREGAIYTLWTEMEIRSNMLKLANWRRVIAWMSATRGRSLTNIQIELAAFFRAKESASLSDIEIRFGEPMFPLYAAAVFRGIQRGDYLADLDKAPLCPSTIIIPCKTRV